MLDYQYSLNLPAEQLVKPHILAKNAVATTKKFYELIPSILSGNLKYKKNGSSDYVLNSFFSNSEAEEVFFDVLLYSFLHHYEKIVNQFDNIFQDYYFDTNTISYTARELKKTIVPEITSFLETRDKKTTLFTEAKISFKNQTGDVLEDNEVQESVFNSISKNCNYLNIGQTQYFSHICNHIEFLQQSKNPEIQRKSHLFFKSIDRDFFTAMLILNYIKSPNQFLTFEITNKNSDHSNKSSVFHLIDSSNNYQPNEHHKGMLKILPYFEAHKKNPQICIDYFSGFDENSITSEVFLPTYQKLDKDIQLALWRASFFQGHIQDKTKKSEFFFLKNLHTAFKENQDIVSSPYFELIHKENPLQLTLKQTDDNILSFRVNYIDLYSGKLNKNPILNFSLNSADDEIHQNFFGLTNLISMELINEKLIGEYSETRHSNVLDHMKNGITFSFSNNGQLSELQFAIFVEKIADAIENFVNNSHKKENEILITFQSRLVKELKTYYQECLLASDIQHLNSDNIKSGKANKF